MIGGDIAGLDCSCQLHWRRCQAVIERMHDLSLIMCLRICIIDPVHFLSG